jgi:hypothetical protein
LFAALSFNCFSQNEGYVAVSAGAGLPTGHFGSADASDSAAGFARPGLNFGLNFARKVSKKISVCGTARNQSNALDVDAFVKQFEKKYPNIQWKMQAENWKIQLFMVGAYSSFPIGDSSFSVDLKVMAGYAACTLPGFTITGTQSGSSITAMENSANSGALCFAIGIGFKKNISEMFCVLGGLDYVGTKPNFTGVAVNFSNGTRQEVNVTQSITLVIITAGIGFRL